MKRHIDPDRYEGWSTCFPLFKPLTVIEREQARKGAAALEQRYPGTRLFPDPYLEVERPRPETPLSALRLVVPGDSVSQSVAARLVSEIRSRWCIEVPTVSDDDPRRVLHAAEPLLILGGSERNRVAMEIARTHRIGPFDAVAPGPGGWGLTTHGELEAGMAFRYLLAFDNEETASAAVDAFLSDAVDLASGTPQLRWVHRVAPGPALQEAAGDFETNVAEDLKRFLSRSGNELPTLQAWLASGRRRPYREVVRDVFCRDLIDYYWTHGALLYNAEFLDIGIRALHDYQWTGNEAALGWFRETMWGLWNYFNSKDAQIYLSDIDFRIGLLCNDWNWVEHDPLISPEERRTFTLLLLGLVRMAHGYYLQNWKDRRPYVNFNHITFKARTLILGWRYFRRWDLPDLPEWRAEAERVFERIELERSKQREDAATYEAFVPDHTLTWLGATGRPVPEPFQQALALLAKRDWAMTDNFFWPVEYGDSNTVFARKRPFQVAPWLEGQTAEQEEIRLLERSSAGVFPIPLSQPAVWSFSGLHHETEGQPFPADRLTGWTRVPLDPSFARQYRAAGSEAEWFDKLVWRSAWRDDAAYLSLGGIGKGNGPEVVSHAHHETSSVLRMNLGGRIWLVNNGYGRPDKALPSAVSFATRQIGPEDHNTLVVREAASGKAVPQPFNARLLDFGDGAVPHAVTEVAGYGGVNWRRVVFVVPDVGFLFLDHVAVADGTDEMPPLELQWNGLGKRSGDAHRSRLEQNGVALEFDHLGSSTAEWKESGIAAWREAIRSGAYPHTGEMPQQGILRPTLPPGRTLWFANGLWLEGSVISAQWEETTRVLRLETAKPFTPTASLQRPWGRMECRGAMLTVIMAPFSSSGG